MRLEIDPAGLDRAVNQPGVHRFLNHVADAAVRGVEQVAPVGPTKQFKGSITKTTVERTAKGPRIVVYSTDWAAHLVEYGSVNNVAFAPFRRTAARLGLHLEGGGGRP